MYTDHHTLKYFATSQQTLRDAKKDGVIWCKNFIWNSFIRRDLRKIAKTFSRIMYNMSFTVLESSLIKEINEAQLEAFLECVYCRIEPDRNNMLDPISSNSSSSKFQVHLPISHSISQLIMGQTIQLIRETFWWPNLDEMSISMS